MGQGDAEHEWTVSSAGQVVTDIASVVSRSTDSEANARLIAAAPALLTALRGMVAMCERSGFPMLAYDIKAAQTAIAQADPDTTKEPR